MKMGSLLEWDTNFFGYPIGKVIITKDENLDLKILRDGLICYKLAYVFADYELPANSGFNLVDTKVVFSKVCEFQKTNENIIEFCPQSHSYDQLLNLAYLSGEHSRFRLDENFSKDEFRKLYKEWLEKSIAKVISDKIFISHEANDISGFITLGSIKSKKANIGLIAVKSNYQGRNIGSNLIKVCEGYSYKNGCEIIEVATQKKNKAAMKLYEKNGFRVNNVQYIYHIWNK